MALPHRIALSILALAMAACRTAGPASGEARLVTGAWGGAHISLRLGPDGGVLEYDCASGTIDQSLRTGASGRFAARGTHVPGQGGPEREGYEPPRLSAEYSGEVDRDRMTLIVRVPSIDLEIGPLALRRGAEPIILRCL